MVRYRILISFIVILFFCSGCVKHTEKYTSFYNSLISEEGNYCFRGLPKGLGWEDVKNQENLKQENLRPSVDATYVTENSPVSFQDFNVTFERGYFLDDFLKLKGACYIFVTEKEEELKQVCKDISEFAKERLHPNPQIGSAEKIASLPTVEELRENLSNTTRWRDRSADGTELEIRVDTLRANGIRVIIMITYPNE